MNSMQTNCIAWIVTCWLAGPMLCFHGAMLLEYLPHLSLPPAHCISYCQQQTDHVHQYWALHIIASFYHCHPWYVYESKAKYSKT
jgi:hypothetical protein